MRQDRFEFVSEGDIETFERDGVVCLRNVLSSDEVEHLRKAVRKQMDQLGKSATGYDFEALARQVWDKSEPIETGAANRFDMQAMKDLVRGDVEARPLVEGGEGKGEGLFFYDVAAWKWDKGVRKVAFDSGLPGIATELLGASYLNFWEDTTFVKAPHTGQKTAFHQDLAYFQIAGDQCVIIWIPLDPVSRNNGTMQYVRGSHKWGDTYAPNVFISQTPMASSPENDVRTLKRIPASITSSLSTSSRAM